MPCFDPMVCHAGYTIWKGNSTKSIVCGDKSEAYQRQLGSTAARREPHHDYSQPLRF
jgi:hypothetical protein